MRNRAWLQVVAAVWWLGGCGGVAELNGDDAGDAGHEGVSNDASTKTPTDSANGPGDAGNGNPDDLPDATGFASEMSVSSGPRINIDPTVYRFYPNGTTAYTFRSSNLDPNAIDLQDCDDNIALQFNLTISGLPTTDAIDVWAGATDCSQASAREAGPGPHCWQVAPSGTFANAQQEYGLIYARDITRFVGVSNPSGELDAVTGVPDTSACDSVGPLTSTCITSLNLYFMYMPPGVGAGGTPDSYTTYAQSVFTVAGDGGSCP